MLTSLPYALIPKEVHIIGAPLHVTLNVECAGYSWRCTEHSKIVRICFAFSVFLSYSQATVYALSVCPCPVHLCVVNCFLSRSCFAVYALCSRIVCEWHVKSHAAIDTASIDCCIVGQSSSTAA